MGLERRLLVAVVIFVTACGGRSRSEHDMAGSGGTGGSGGATGGVSGAASSDGGRTETSCGRRVVDYLAQSSMTCESLDFACAPGSAIFIDECGCGCDSSPFQESSGTIATDTVSDACNGPSGPFALFETPPQHLIIGENTVHVRVGRRGDGDQVSDWAIDKRTGAVSLGPPWEGLTNAAGTVVSGPEPLESDGVVYSRSSTGMLTAEADGKVRVLFQLPGYDPKFIVTGTDVYTASYDGVLSHGVVEPLFPPELVERRGELDDDDPYPVIVGADRDAIYWTAGPYTDGQVTDGDPSMLYRTCR